MKEYINKSLEKALKVLEAFSSSSWELSVSEISKKTNIGLGSLYPIIGTLEKKGYLKKNKNKMYHLGFKFVTLSNLTLEGLNLIGITKPFLHNLAYTIKGNSHLAIFYDWKALIIDRESYNEHIYIKNIIGYQAQLHNTSLGKIFLAYLNRDEVIKFLDSNKLEKTTPYTKTNPSELIAELDTIVLQGYAVNDEEYNIGEISYASPIFDAQNQVIASINISFVKNSHSLDDQIPYKVKENAAQVSKLLGSTRYNLLTY